MRGLILVLALSVLLNVAWGFTQVVNQETSSNSKSVHVNGTDEDRNLYAGQVRHNEGWADYFADTINNNSCMAEGFAGECSIPS